MNLRKLSRYTLILSVIAHVAGQEEEIEYSNETGDCECDVEVYEANQDHGVIKSPHYPNFDGCNGKCIYMILPHPNKTVSLYTSQFSMSSYASLIIYSLIIEDDGRQIQIPHARVRRPKSYYYSSADQSFPGFVSAKNVGFEIHFISHTTNYYTNFKMSFDRYTDDENVCDYPIVEVGLEETVIQRPHPYNSASGCVYMLKTKEMEDEAEEDQILITIDKNYESMVVIRSRNENGKFVFKEETSIARSVTVSAYNVQIMSHKLSRTDGIYKMAKITAKLIKKGCQCEPAENMLNENTTSITIHSPGYPALYCPRKHCSHHVLKDIYQDVGSKLGIFEVLVNALIGANDVFSLKTDFKHLIDITRYKSSPVLLNKKFVVKRQHLVIEYHTTNEYIKRFFEVKVKQLFIPPECSCTFNKDKEIGKLNDIHFDASFPSYCTYIYCNFQFPAQYTWRSRIRALIDFKVEHATDDDVINIKDEKHEEIFEGEMLHRVKRFEVVLDTDFTFYRDNIAATEPTRLTFNYTKLDEEQDCSSNPTNVQVDLEKPAIITSPAYPHLYGNNLDCQYIVSVPENCRLTLSIDEITVENYHDYVRIYEGNSTDGKLIASYTAHVSHEVLNISTPVALIYFETDQSTTDRGFHISATAHVLDEIEDDAYTRTFILIGVTVAVLVLIVACIYAYEKYAKPWMENRRNRQNPPQAPAAEQAAENADNQNLL